MPVIEKMNIVVMMLSVELCIRERIFQINILHGEIWHYPQQRKKNTLLKNLSGIRDSGQMVEKISGRIFLQMEDSTMKASMIRLEVIGRKSLISVSCISQIKSAPYVSPRH